MKFLFPGKNKIRRRLAILLLPGLLLAGCRTLPQPVLPDSAGPVPSVPREVPQEVPRETPGEVPQEVPQEVLPEVPREIPPEVLWEPLEEGLDFYSLSVPSLPLALYALRADLSGSLWELVFTPSGGPGEWEMAGMTTSRFLSKTAGRAAINGTPFEPYRYFFPQRGQNLSGLYILEGREVSRPLPEYYALVEQAGRLEILPQEDFLREDGFSARDLNAAGGAQKLLTRGVVEAQIYTSRDARTAVGISRDGGTLFLLVADGRRKNHSRGLTLEETGEWLKVLGAWEGLNLDGGGSAVMVLADEKGRPRVINRPVNRRGFPERIVAAHIGIRKVQGERP